MGTCGRRFRRARFPSNRRFFRRNRRIFGIGLRGNPTSEPSATTTTTETRKQKKSNWLNKQNKNSERAAHRFWQISLPSLHDWRCQTWVDWQFDRRDLDFVGNTHTEARASYTMRYLQAEARASEDLARSCYSSFCAEMRDFSSRRPISVNHKNVLLSTVLSLPAKLIMNFIFSYTLSRRRYRTRPALWAELSWRGFSKSWCLELLEVSLIFVFYRRLSNLGLQLSF